MCLMARRRHPDGLLTALGLAELKPNEGPNNQDKGEPNFCLCEAVAEDGNFFEFFELRIEKAHTWEELGAKNRRPIECSESCGRYQLQTRGGCGPERKCDRQNCEQ